MNYNLTIEQEMIKKLIRDFTEKEIAPYDGEMDRTGEFPWEIINKIKEAELFGISFPEEYGGAGGDQICEAIVLEEMARGSASTAITLDTHMLCATAILTFGSEEQKKKYLTDLVSGNKLGAFALTEPSSGSDVGGIQSKAVLEDNEYILNGQKAWITNAHVADIFVVAALTNPSLGSRGISCFIIEKDFTGFKAGNKEDKMGIRGSDTGELIFDNCKIPRENLLGEEGKGFKIAMVSLDTGRIGIGAIGVGIAQHAMEEAIKYAKERKAFGRTISQLQAIQFKIADMMTGIEASRTLVYKAAYKKKNGERFTLDSAMAKLMASEVAMKTTKDAIQIFGAYGYSREYPVERLMRDAKVLEIGEGTSEVLRMLIGSKALG